MGGERQVTGKIYCNSSGFGVPTVLSDDYDGTARPRAEIELLLCAYTVLQSVSLRLCLR